LRRAATARRRRGRAEDGKGRTGASNGDGGGRDERRRRARCGVCNLRKRLAGRTVRSIGDPVVCANFCAQLLPTVVQVAELVQRRTLLHEQQQGEQWESQRETKPTHGR